MINFKERSETEQLDFFERSYNQYKKASQHNLEHNDYFMVAGKVYCLRFLGTELRRILIAALEHLRVPACGEVDVTLHVWDSESTGTAMSPPPCDWDAFTDRGDIWGFNSKRIRTAFHYSDYSVNLYDHQRAIGIYWVQNSKSIPYWTTSAPFRTLFQWSLSGYGLQLIHAAGVGKDRNLFIITGKGGVGKSSTALACINAGMDYIGDDYIIVENGSPQKAYSLYSTAKLFNDDIGRFPNLSQLVGERQSKEQEKGVYQLYPDLQAQIKKEGVVKAFLVPSITGKPDPSSFQAIPKWRVEKAMAFTTISQLPGAGEDTSEYIKKLVEDTPCFEAKLSNEFNEIPASILQMLASDFESYREPPLNSSGDQPLISVVIPVFNAAEFILDAITSVNNQGYSTIEIIVIDDGSTDELKHVLEESNADVRYLYQENEGPSSARNRGILNCTGSYIAFLDVDDYWPENNLRTLLHEMTTESDMMVVQGFGQVVKNNSDGSVAYLGNPKESFPFYIGAALYRKEVFTQVGLFDTSMKYGEDTDWYNRLIESQLKYKRINQTSLYVRRHGNNMTEGRDLVDLGVLQVFKKKLERDRKRESHTFLENQDAQNPLVSVIIPVYNGELFVAEAIDSVLRQDYGNLEIIVINDGSTDKTSEALAIFGDQIRIVNQTNRGVSAARNVGIKNSTGDYIAFLDADDLWLPSKLGRQVSEIQSSKADIVVGLMKSTGLDTKIEETRNINAKAVLSMIPGASLFRKAVFETVGDFDERLENYEDMDWFFKAREKKTRINVQNETCLIARSHAGSFRDSNFDKSSLLKAYKNSLLRRKSNNQAQLPDLNLGEIMNKSN